jgi:Glycosyl transferase 4-like domain
LARVDLHVHSKHSNRPTEWILRQAGAPESFTEPKEIYRRCRERGMQFVTVSDHDSVEGALEIQHLPGTFLSSEVTVEFPEDGCEIHLLVLGITEEQHRDLQEIRRNIYEVRDYVRGQGLLYSVAHPLFRVNNRLTLDQVEKLLVLFDRFEARNGMHDRRANDLVRRIFGSLTPEVIEDLAERHRLEPFGPAPWVKTFTGGSDDHGGLYLGTTWTETPEAATVEDFLGHLRAGRHEPGGATGSSARLLQSFYTLSYEHYRRQFPFGLERRDPFSRLLRGLALPPGAAEERRRFWGWRRPQAPASAAGPTGEQATFRTASRASQKHLARMFRDLVRHARRGRLMEGLASVAQLAPFALSVAPHLVAVHSLHKDADLLDAASERFLGRRLEGRSGKRVWLTDSLFEADGMTEVLDTLPGAGSGPLEAVTCASSADSRLPGIPVHRFRAWLQLPLPGRDKSTLAIPPVLEVIDLCESERYDEIVISSPGPFGLLGLLAGKLLGIPVTAVWREDLSVRVRFATASETLAEMAWVYQRWLFAQAQRIWVPSQPERKTLIARGFDAEKLAVIPAGRSLALVAR